LTNDKNRLQLRHSPGLTPAFPYTVKVHLCLDILTDPAGFKNPGGGVNELLYSLWCLSQYITLQERTRIAREIHDSLEHSLTALNLQLETALKLWQSNPAKAQTFLAQAKKLGSQALQEVRQSASAMQSASLPGRSLKQTFEQAQFARSHSS
jgi:signal transduction histidine kinase